MNTITQIETTAKNQTVQAQSFADAQHLRSEGWRHYQHPASSTLQLPQGQFSLRPGLTFTPFANPVACNAHCVFCSEELKRKGGHEPTAQHLIEDQPRWLSGLEQVLEHIVDLPKGFSLSGLEATADPAWMLAVLDLVKRKERICQWQDKVLYTNGSGLLNHPALLEALKGLAFDRIELSRCHWDEGTNQQIMRFNRNQPVWRSEGYEQVVRLAHDWVNVRNSCILTRAGVGDLPAVERYLDYAHSLGVREVVFRELSRMGEAYEPTPQVAWIEANRVPIEELLHSVWGGEGEMAEGWAYEHSTLGYYYYNEHFLWKGKVKVVLETSSYPALMQANASGVIHKLVYHSNGNLCGDWDPQSLVLGTYPHA
jgi:MoaA/NifB/PqqE/SkfB family radical SAM enzyme